jgi:hypothetical protein
MDRYVDIELCDQSEARIFEFIKTNALVPRDLYVIFILNKDVIRQFAILVIKKLTSHYTFFQFLIAKEIGKLHIEFTKT